MARCVRASSLKEVPVRAKLLRRNGETNYVLVFETGDDVMAGLIEFAKSEQLEASDFTAIGAFSEVVLGYFDVTSKTYREIPVEEQVEVLTMLGNITREADGEPKVHAHVVVGLADGTTRGGHLLAARVRPTLELAMTEEPVELRRRFNAEAGLALIDV
jgi:predicted DNA-binding protein with PD1-like motif